MRSCLQWKAPSSLQFVPGHPCAFPSSRAKTKLLLAPLECLLRRRSSYVVASYAKAWKGV